jgi:hypothetical protein
MDIHDLALYTRIKFDLDTMELVNVLTIFVCIIST